jgi:hypothetical protein
MLMLKCSDVRLLRAAPPPPWPRSRRYAVQHGKKKRNVMKSLKLAARMTAVLAILGAMVLGIEGPYERAMSSFIDGYSRTRLKVRRAAAMDSTRTMMTLGGFCAACMLVAGLWLAS